MLSFFSKKKQNNDTQPEDVIQGPTDPQQQNNGGTDDFIFVERKTTPDDPAQQPVRSMYPPMPPAFGGGGSALPYPAPYPPALGGKKSSGSINLNTPTSYLQDVPFELSPQLCTKSLSDVTQLQVDGILAFMTRQISVDESAEGYTFALERSIQNECY